MVRWWSRALLASLLIAGFGSAAGAADDFEADLHGWVGLTRSKAFARGEWSGRWLPTDKVPQISRPVAPFPDGDFAGLQFSLYSARANGARLIIRLDAEDPAQAGLDYYGYDLTVDWQGWRDFALPLYAFYVARKPQRPRISQVVLAANFLERRRDGTDLYLDNFAVVERIDAPVITIDDMETGLRRWTGLQATQEPVRRGHGAGLWANPRQRPLIQMTRCPGDWSGYAALCLALHTQAPCQTPLTVVVRSENPASPGEDYYRCDVPLSHTGWRDLQLPLIDFKAVRSPLGWDRVTGVVLAVEWDHTAPGPETPLAIDEVALARYLRLPEVLLDDLEEGTQRWQHLEPVADRGYRGGGAGRWVPGTLPPPRLSRIPRDWRGYGALHLAAMSPQKSDARLQLTVVSDCRATAAEDGFTHEIPLDWEGWRELSVPLRKMRPQGSPSGWGDISGLRLTVAAGTGGASPSELLFDDARLLPVEGPQPAWRRVLDDLESGVRRWKGLEPETIAVAQGRASGRWTDPRANPKVSFSGLPTDLSCYTHLCLSMYSGGSESPPSTLTFMFDSDNPDTEAWDYYRYQMPLNWRGWRHLTIPLAECQAATGATPQGWQAVRGLTITADAGGPPAAGLQLVIDNVEVAWRPAAARTVRVTSDSGGSLKWVIGLRNCSQVPLLLSQVAVSTVREGVSVTAPQAAETPLAPGTETELALSVKPAPASATWSPLASCELTVSYDGQVAQQAQVDLSPVNAALAMADRQHPRLVAGADEMAGLLAALGGASGSQWQAIKEGARQRAKAVAAAAGPAVLADPAKSARLANQAAACLAWSSLIEAIEPQEEWLARCREQLAYVQQAQSWVLPEHSRQGVDECSAVTGMLLALSYDWLQPRLTEAERTAMVSLLDTRVLAKLGEDLAAARPYTRRPDDSTCALIFSAAGVAALATVGEAPNAEAMATECYQHLREVLDLAPDGGWAEGPFYWGRWMNCAAVFSEAMERVSKGLVPLAGHAYYAGAGDFALYLAPDQRGFFSVGDSGILCPCRTALMWLARRQNDTQLMDLALKQPVTETDVLNLLWGRPLAGEARPPQRPSSRLFEDLGWTVLRSGWMPEDLTCFVRSGPRGLHGHLDAGDIALAAGGRRFLRDSGRDSSGDPGYLDPVKRWTFPKATTGFHNCLLINGQGQTPAAAGGRVTSFVETPLCDFVSADATACYQGARAVSRSVLLSKPGYLLLHDRVEQETAGPVTARFHPGEGVRITQQDKLITLTAQDMVLELSVLYPAQYTIEQGQHDPQTPFFDIILPAGIRHDLVVSLRTFRPGAAVSAPAGAPEVKTDVEGLTIAFAAGRWSDTLRIGSSGTYQWVSEWPEQHGVRALCRQAQTITGADGRALVRATVPLLCAGGWASDGCFAKVILTKDGVVELAVDRKPSALQVDGAAAAVQMLETPTRLRLPLAEGVHDIALRY